MGFVAKDGDRALLERTVKQYFQKLLGLDIKDFSRFEQADVEKFVDPGLARDELRELMKSVEYPEGWFFVERAVVILFGLSAQLAPDTEHDPGRLPVRHAAHGHPHGGAGGGAGGRARAHRSRVKGLALSRACWRRLA